jgi:hypothetical protein
MSRTAHVWFVAGMFMSAALAVVVWIVLDAIGAIDSVGKMVTVGTLEALVLILVLNQLTKWYRARQRMHERVSRELRCASGGEAEAGR